MSEVKKIATRMSYGNALVELGKEHDDLLVFEADLGGATKTTIFRDVFPDRHIECGIAEANMVGSRYFNNRNRTFCIIICNVYSR